MDASTSSGLVSSLRTRYLQCILDHRIFSCFFRSIVTSLLFRSVCMITLDQSRDQVQRHLQALPCLCHAQGQLQEAYVTNRCQTSLTSIVSPTCAVGCRPPASTGSAWQEKLTSAGAQHIKIPVQTRDTDILNMFLSAPSASLDRTLPHQFAGVTAQHVSTEGQAHAQQDTSLPPATCPEVHPPMKTWKAKAPSGTMQWLKPLFYSFSPQRVWNEYQRQARTTCHSILHTANVCLTCSL